MEDLAFVYVFQAWPVWEKALRGEPDARAEEARSKGAPVVGFRWPFVGRFVKCGSDHFFAVDNIFSNVENVVHVLEVPSKFLVVGVFFGPRPSLVDFGDLKGICWIR